MDENDLCYGYGNYFESAVLKVTWFKLCSKFFLNNYEAHWRRHLKDTLQLKILRTWTNIHVNSFLGKYHKWKMGGVAIEIISCTKIWACSLKNIAPGHFTNSYILLCLSNKPSFYVQPSSLRWIICTTICLPLRLDIMCILKFIQCLHTFFIRTSKVLIELGFFVCFFFTAAKRSS